MKKTILIASAVIIVILIIFILLINNFYNKIYNPKSSQSTKKQEIIKKTSYNFLLLGYAGGNHQGTFLTDTIIIVHVNKKDKRVVLISVPRDVWVKIPTKSKDNFHGKINTVYQVGLYPKNYPDVNISYIKESSVGLLSHTIKQIIGLDIDNYITVDFAGFVKAIDILGGVNVNVE